MSQQPRVLSIVARMEPLAAQSGFVVTFSLIFARQAAPSGLRPSRLRNVR